MTFEKIMKIKTGRRQREVEYQINSFLCVFFS